MTHIHIHLPAEQSKTKKQTAKYVANKVIIGVVVTVSVYAISQLAKKEVDKLIS